jgi:hypothetical protein
MTAQDMTNNKQQTTNEMINTKKSESLQAFNTATRVPVHLQTALTVKTPLPNGQWLEEQVNMLKSQMFRTGTRRPTVSRTGGRYLLSLKIFIENKAFKRRRLLCSVSKFNLLNKFS